VPLPMGAAGAFGAWLVVELWLPGGGGGGCDHTEVSEISRIRLSNDSFIRFFFIVLCF
jgi:hypothetical protein